MGDIYGTVNKWDYATAKNTLLYSGSSAVTSFTENHTGNFVTEVGILEPSEAIQGKITITTADSLTKLPFMLKRPVHTLVEDLDDDGELEFIVSEFGNETGQLTLIQKQDGGYVKKNLLALPGCIRTIARDMNSDDKLDLIVMSTQGNEAITIFYQNKDLSFTAQRVIEFDPVYGSSWFELLDYNHDGFLDIITVNGDNADKSFVHKPYHGLRIFLNDGDNEFKEVYFYPLNGATRFVAEDFDSDGDFDFGIISTFPDYDKDPYRSFVYLENLDAENYTFSTSVLSNHDAGRWFLADVADIDTDGDQDIVLSSFSYVFTPIPETLQQKWNTGKVDIMVLQNQLNK